MRRMGRLHIYLRIYHQFKPNVGKYSSPMEHLVSILMFMTFMKGTLLTLTGPSHHFSSFFFFGPSLGVASCRPRKIGVARLLSKINTEAFTPKKKTLDVARRLMGQIFDGQHFLGGCWNNIPPSYQLPPQNISKVCGYNPPTTQ